MREHHIKVGKDISLVSFDDSLMAQMFTPPVTVVSRPTIEMGYEAAEMLLHMLRGDGAEKTHTMMDVELIRRGSVAGI